MAAPPVDDRYRIIGKLGEGSYGSVYEAIDTVFNEEVVIKIGHDRHALYLEHCAYSELHKNWSPIGIPMVFNYVKSRYDYLVMQKLGKNIKDYWYLCGRRFSLKTMLMLGSQMISRVESVHNRGWVHGDIKGDNFVMDAENSGTLYIIDFGLSSNYINLRNGNHIREDYDVHVAGTISYASINTHNYIRYSRRDDIEGLAYLLIRYLKGRLPWEEGLDNSGGNFHEVYKRAGRTKALVSMEDLCHGLPEQIMQFLMHARRLKFQERPDYGYLQELLRRAMREHNLSFDGVYDWMDGNGFSGDYL